MYEPPYLLPEIPRQHTVFSAGGFIKSDNYVENVSGWKLDGTGFFYSAVGAVIGNLICRDSSGNTQIYGVGETGVLSVGLNTEDGSILWGNQSGGNTRIRFDGSADAFLVDIDGTSVLGILEANGLQLGVAGTGTGTDLVIQGISNYVLKKSSSIRYKNVADVNMSDYLTPSMVDSLEPKMFSYKSDDSNHPMIGLIAENCDSVSPFLAYHDNEQVESIDKDALISLLIIALKDARTRIAALES